MSHFAEVIDGIVIRVIVVEQEFIDSGSIGEPIRWIQTSYNTRGGIHYDNKTGQPSKDQSKSLRYNFACIGCAYDEVRDAFIEETPFESWILNESTCLWESPVPYPNDGGNYYWDEVNQSWNKIIKR